MNTSDCTLVYQALTNLKEKVKQSCTLDTTESVVIVNEIEFLTDLFCDFECGWKEHVDEVHPLDPEDVTT